MIKEKICPICRETHKNKDMLCKPCKENEKMLYKACLLKTRYPLKTLRPVYGSHFEPFVLDSIDNFKKIQELLVHTIQRVNYLYLEIDRLQQSVDILMRDKYSNQTLEGTVNTTPTIDELSKKHDECGKITYQGDDEEQIIEKILTKTESYSYIHLYLHELTQDAMWRIPIVRQWVKSFHEGTYKKGKDKSHIIIPGFLVRHNWYLLIKSLSSEKDPITIFWGIDK